MEFTGLVQKFKVNRPLNHEERALQLRQSERIDRTPADQISCIRMNSTYLEMVDVYYAHKGWATFGVVAGWFVTGGLWLYSAVRDLLHPGPYFAWWDIALSLLAATVLGMVAAWLLRFECFRLTHYPIRFNRKTRKVHVFRVDGTVLTADWDDLFFCLGRNYQRSNWTVQGHVLDKDRATVLETFSLAAVAGSDGEKDLLRNFWEFPRRYMAEGPQAVVEHAMAMVPIAEHRESFRFGLHRTLVQFGPIGWLLTPFYILFYPGRWFALHTCRIPRWPDDIEATCRIEPGDRFVRDASTNPPHLRK